MRSLICVTLIALFGCSAQTTSPEVPNVLPATSDIQRPDDPAAADMLDQFLLLMEERMALAESIGRIETRDQYVREVFIGMFSDPALDPAVRKAFQDTGGEYLARIDELNTKELKVALDGISWRSLVEKENNLFKRAFHIVQHSTDDAYRAQVLQEIKPLAEEGLIEGQQFALMFDRVQLKQDGTQLYGTQYKCINDQYDVYGLDDPESVDERRSNLGMGLLSDYLNQAREYYGPCSE